MNTKLEKALANNSLYRIGDSAQEGLEIQDAGVLKRI